MFRRIKSKHFKMIFNIIIIVSVIFFVYSFIEKSLMPSLIAISKGEAKIIANKVIDTSVKESVKEKNIKTQDFFIYLNEGKQLTANTILINELCADVSLNINKGLKSYEEKYIYVASGALTGMELFSNTGPKTKFKIRQIGETFVDYETSFSSAGINQTNYKAWIKVNIEIKLIHPIKSEIVTAERKVMLIDTVIEGKVPDRFLNIE